MDGRGGGKREWRWLKLNQGGERGLITFRLDALFICTRSRRSRDDSDF